MKPENKKFLDDNRRYHTTLVQAHFMAMLDGNTRSEFVRVMNEEFQPGYTADLWCPPCVSDMVLAVYRRYDEYLAANPEPVPIAEPALVVEPIIDPPVTEDESEYRTDPADDFAPKAPHPKNYHRR